VEADPLRRLGRRDHGPELELLGPVKPTIKQFQELPYTTDDAEFNALVGGKLDVGYLPFQT